MIVVQLALCVLSTIYKRGTENETISQNIDENRNVLLVNPLYLRNNVTLIE